MAAARGRILGHLNADEQYDRAGLAHALQKFDQSKADAVFGPTIMLDGQLNFLYLFNQITIPRPIDADWHMPVQTCSFLFRRGIWERWSPFGTPSVFSPGTRTTSQNASVHTEKMPWPT